MTHFLAACATDIRMLWRTGYVAATLAVFLVLLIVVLQIARIDFTGFADIMAAIALTDLSVSCSFLIGLMLLLERDEGTIAALAVTPMSRTAYVAAKTVTVSVISSLQMMLLVLLAYDGALSIPFLIFGLFGIAIIVTLLGFVIAAPYDTLYRLLLPVIGWSFFLSIPAYGVFFDWRPVWLSLHPITPPMIMLEAAFTEIPHTRLYFGVAGTAVWAVIAAAGAFWSFGRMRVHTAGS